MWMSTGLGGAADGWRQPYGQIRPGEAWLVWAARLDGVGAAGSASIPAPIGGLWRSPGGRNPVPCSASHRLSRFGLMAHVECARQACWRTARLASPRLSRCISQRGGSRMGWRGGFLCGAGSAHCVGPL